VTIPATGLLAAAFYLPMEWLVSWLDWLLAMKQLCPVRLIWNTWQWYAPRMTRLTTFKGQKHARED